MAFLPIIPTSVSLPAIASAENFGDPAHEQRALWWMRLTVRLVNMNSAARHQRYFTGA